MSDDDYAMVVKRSYTVLSSGLDLHGMPGLSESTRSAAVRGAKSRSRGAAGREATRRGVVGPRGAKSRSRGAGRHERGRAGGRGVGGGWKGKWGESEEAQGRA